MILPSLYLRSKYTYLMRISSLTFYQFSIDNKQPPNNRNRPNEILTKQKIKEMLTKKQQKQENTPVFRTSHNTKMNSKDNSQRKYPVIERKEFEKQSNQDFLLKANAAFKGARSSPSQAKALELIKEEILNEESDYYLFNLARSNVRIPNLLETFMQNYGDFFFQAKLTQLSKLMHSQQPKIYIQLTNCVLYLPYLNTLDNFNNWMRFKAISNVCTQQIHVIYHIYENITLKSLQPSQNLIDRLIRFFYRRFLYSDFQEMMSKLFLRIMEDKRLEKYIVRESAFQQIILKRLFLTIFNQKNHYPSMKQLAFKFLQPSNIVYFNNNSVVSLMNKYLLNPVNLKDPLSQAQILKVFLHNAVINKVQLNCFHLKNIENYLDKADFAIIDFTHQKYQKIANIPVRNENMFLFYKNNIIAHKHKQIINSFYQSIDTLSPYQIQKCLIHYNLTQEQFDPHLIKLLNVYSTKMDRQTQKLNLPIWLNQLRKLNKSYLIPTKLAQKIVQFIDNTYYYFNVSMSDTIMVLSQLQQIQQITPAHEALMRRFKNYYMTRQIQIKEELKISHFNQLIIGYHIAFNKYELYKIQPLLLNNKMDFGVFWISRHSLDSGLRSQYLKDILEYYVKEQVIPSYHCQKLLLEKEFPQHSKLINQIKFTKKSLFAQLPGSVIHNLNNVGLKMEVVSTPNKEIVYYKVEKQGKQASFAIINQVADTYMTKAKKRFLNEYIREATGNYHITILNQSNEAISTFLFNIANTTAQN